MVSGENGRQSLRQAVTWAWQGQVARSENNEKSASSGNNGGQHRAYGIRSIENRSEIKHGGENVAKMAAK